MIPTINILKEAKLWRQLKKKKKKNHPCQGLGRRKGLIRGRQKIFKVVKPFCMIL